MTLLHYGVNRSIHNYSLATKRERLFLEANLHLNRQFMRADKWDETTIDQRSRTMFEIAFQTWRGPTA
ncbi:MAG: HNH endonuclease [Hyphomicrobium sp.]|nr:HNH endonuclease [Hyphomicrobium sp.]